MTNSNDPFNPNDSGNDDPFADKLKAIKNDNGEPKYKSTEDALEALLHAQQFIETLKQEKHGVDEQLQQLQAELSKRESVEDVVKRLVKNPEKPPVTNDRVEPQGLNEDKIRDMMEQLLNNRTQEEQQNRNVASVVNKLTEEYGDKVNEVINTRARELNTTPEQLKELSKTNPTMALNLLSNQKVVSKDPTKPSLTPSRDKFKTPDLPKPERSVMQGGMSNKELADVWAQVREHTYRKLGVE